MPIDNDESITERLERRRVEAMALQEEFNAVEAEGRAASERGDSEGVLRAQARQGELIAALRELTDQASTSHQEPAS